METLDVALLSFETDPNANRDAPPGNRAIIHTVLMIERPSHGVIPPGPSSGVERGVAG